VKAAAVAAAGFLLTGGGVALAAPGSNGDKNGGNGGDKPSATASGSSAGKNGTTAGNSGSAPGSSGSAPGKTSSGPGKPATTPPGNSPGPPNPGPKNLPDAAPPVAAGATGKTNPASTGTPNSFGKSVAATASSQQGQGNGPSPSFEIPSATAVPSATASVTVTIPLPASMPIPIPLPVTIPSSVPVTVTAAPSTSAGDSEFIPAPSHAVRNGAVPTAPRPEPSEAVTRGNSGPQQRVQAAPPAAASATAATAVSISPPQSTGAAAGPSPTAGAETPWIGRVATQVVDEVREALREVSLKELALAALPGLVGMLFLFSAGIGIGHRQAKFGFALESTGALRFAMRGPLGVVRPGGFIAMPARRPSTLLSRAA
jgi:hypothetical protein